MYTLVVAEKPSVGRDIARVLGCRDRGEGCLSGGAYCVTWAVGHLVSLCEPDEIDAKWKQWRAEALPILPETIPLKILPKTKAQFGVIRKLMRAADCRDIVCATDAGREGELIFRYILQMAGCAKPVRRLWISSMTDQAICEGFASLKPSAEYDALYESARCRSEADWLVGMNASRAFTVRYGALLSIGRVQTPTLKLLVRRRLEIEAFAPRDYWTVTAGFGDYEGLWLNEATREKRLYSAESAQAVADKVRGKPAVVESVTREEKKEWPPYLYDLTSLQRDANRLLGYTAQKTLSVAQKLYEEHKLLTYPRTDSRHLPRDMAGKTLKAVQGLPEAYARLTTPVIRDGKLPMIRRVFDDAKVTDHHAIIPTDKKADLDKLPPDAKALYDLVARRLLAAFYPDYVYDAVRVKTRAEGEAFESLGRAVRQTGWKAVYEGVGKEKPDKEEDAQPLPNLSEGDRRTVQKATVKQDKTKPPAPHTDASLLAAMEHAGREIEDEELREAMKKGGLGTPATRAATIERLLAVGYAERKGRTILATDKGVKLIRVAPDDVASPETTGRWEKALSDIASGGMSPDRFLSGIRRLSAALCDAAKAAPGDVAFDKEEGRGKRGAKGARAKAAVRDVGAVCPLCGEGGVMENSKGFYCARFRDGCRFTIWKDAAQKAGGPALTAPLIKRLLAEKRVVGSTGTLVFEQGAVRFERKL